MDIIFYYQILRHIQCIFVQKQDLKKRNGLIMHKQNWQHYTKVLEEKNRLFYCDSKKNIFITRNYLLNWWKWSMQFVHTFAQRTPIDSLKKKTLRCSYGHKTHLHILRNENTHTLFEVSLLINTMHVPRMSLDIQRTLQDIHNWKYRHRDKLCFWWFSL